MTKYIVAAIVAIATLGVSAGISAAIYNSNAETQLNAQMQEVPVRGYFVEIEKDVIAKKAPVVKIILAEATQAVVQKVADVTVDYQALIADADLKRGAKLAKKCAACHTWKEGGKNKVGPNLFGIINADKARNAKFKYSKAMKAKGGKWTDTDLAAFIKKPRKFLKGTKMSFAGFKKEQDIINVLAFLHDATK